MHDKPARKRGITIRCTRSRGPRGFFCLQDFRRGPVIVAVISLSRSLLQNTQAMPSKQLHPTVDFSHWAKIFPLESLGDRTRGYRYTSDGTVDLWKPSGTWVTSPKQLCQIELSRTSAPKSFLGVGVPVDIFLWGTGSPNLPYQTKIGGAPYRNANLDWPTAKNGEPFTFVAQFCFLDSFDVVPRKLPGDVLLIFQHPDYDIEKHGTYTEWVNIGDSELLNKEDLPPTQFRVPELAGFRYRSLEYPESLAYFESEKYDGAYLFPVTQSTKIGTVSFFCQGDPRRRKNKPPLLCTLNSVLPTDEWPFLNLESMPKRSTSRKKKGPPPGARKYELMFGDAGTMYFFLRRSGKIRAYFDCY